ncbi:MAG: hypothetical protein GKR97_13700 [Rhizobiaceae bacterium]|nr:hypothetical protein [Rhizobiaceae bacterium]
MTNHRATPFDRLVQLAQHVFAPVGTNAALNWLMGTIFLVLLVFLAGLAIVQPGYSFDLVAYLGATLHHHDVGTDPMQAWEIVKQVASEDVYRDLSTANDYRVTQSTDQSAFISTLPLYSAKIGYIYWLNGLAPALGWIKAAQWSSLFFGLLFGLIALVWMIRENCLQGAAIVAAVLLATNYFDALRYASPDIIAAAATLAAIYLWTRSREFSASGLLLIAFLFRPDTLLFAFALILSSWAFHLPKWRAVVLFVALLICSYLIRTATDHPGWWVHYYFSNVQIQNTLVGFQPDFSLIAWAKGQARGVISALTQFNWPILLVFILATIAATATTKRFSRRQSAMLLACLLTIAGKFVVFPLPDDRLYMVFVVAMTLLVLQVVQPRLAWR